MIADIHLLLEPDTIVPSQFFATVRRQAPTKQGEYRLLVALLEDAINCFQGNAHAADKVKQRLFDEAHGWITGEDGDTVGQAEDQAPGFSFEYVCDVFGSRRCLSPLGLAAVAHAQLSDRAAQAEDLVMAGTCIVGVRERPASRSPLPGVIKARQIAIVPETFPARTGSTTAPPSNARASTDPKRSHTHRAPAKAVPL